jgi:hypothetical protein
MHQSALYNPKYGINPTGLIQLKKLLLKSA